MRLRVSAAMRPRQVGHLTAHQAVEPTLPNLANKPDDTGLTAGNHLSCNHGGPPRPAPLRSTLTRADL